MIPLNGEAEVASGYIGVTVGGQHRELPTLKIKAAREWKESLAERIPEWFNADRQSIIDVLSIGNDVAFDLVVDYDRSGALGGKEWLEDNADDSEVYRVLKQIIDRHFPFLADVPMLTQMVSRVVGQMRLTGLTAAPSLPASSTSSPLPNGAATHKRSKRN